MFTRSLSSPLRLALRPASLSVPRSALGRMYSDAAESDKPAADAEKLAERATEDEKKIAELEAKVKELTKEMTYMRADYQTLARRATEEKVKAADFAISKFARALLDTTDVLERAVAGVAHPVESGTPLGELLNGVQLTQKALTQTLEHHGIKPMDEPKGKPFDPNLHDATFQVPAAVAPKRADGATPEAGEVIEVPKKGWMIKDRVLRPAQVGVVQIE